MIGVALAEFELLKAEIIELYDAKKMRASGAFAESLKVDSVGNDSGFTINLSGLDYANELEKGSEPKEVSIAKISKWILDKGVFAQALQKIKLSSLAFLIARKISREGWKRQRFGGVELISSIITPQRIQDIIDKIGINYTIEIQSEIIELFNNLEMA